MDETKEYDILSILSIKFSNELIYIMIFLFRFVKPYSKLLVFFKEEM